MTRRRFSCQGYGKFFTPTTKMSPICSHQQLRCQKFVRNEVDMIKITVQYILTLIPCQKNSVKIPTIGKDKFTDA